MYRASHCCERHIKGSIDMNETKSKRLTRISSRSGEVLTGIVFIVGGSRHFRRSRQNLYCKIL